MEKERKNKPDEDQSRSSCVVVVDLDDGAVLTWMMKIKIRAVNDGMEKREERLEKKREERLCLSFCTMDKKRK
jgi:hypothetical protein